MSWGWLYGDDISATFTMASTNYQAFTGSTVVTGQTGDWNNIKPKPTDSTSARLVIGENGNGLYRASFAVSFTADTGNKTYHVALFKNSSKTPMSIERKIGTAGDVGAAGSAGFLVLKNNDYVDLRGSAESSGAQVTVTHFSVALDKITSSTKIGTG